MTTQFEKIRLIPLGVLLVFTLSRSFSSFIHLPSLVLLYSACGILALTGIVFLAKVQLPIIAFADTFSAVILSSLFGPFHPIIVFCLLFYVVIYSGVLSQKNRIVFVSLVLFIYISLSFFWSDMSQLGFSLSLFVNSMAIMLVSFFAAQLTDQSSALGIALEESRETTKNLENINEMLIDNIPAGVLFLGFDSQIRRQNEAASHVINIEHDIDVIFEKINQNDWVKSEFQFELTLGKKDVDFVAREVKDGYIVLFRDLTKIKRLERELKEKEKLAAVGGLAAGIAHEIRNPLASVSGSIEMLQSTLSANDTDSERLMAIVLKEIDRLNRLIQEFLDYANPKIPLEDDIKIKPFLEEFEHLLKVHKDGPENLEIELLVEDRKIKGNRDKLKQAVLNIAINSLHALENCSNPKLKISSQQVSDNLVIEISDNGAGIPENIKARIFEPFLTSKSKGTGLGLALTQKIIESHEGAIGVESTEGQGTTFRLTLPL